MGVKTKSNQRIRRKTRIRKRVMGTVERPRLSVFRSARAFIRRGRSISRRVERQFVVVVSAAAAAVGHPPPSAL